MRIALLSDIHANQEALEAVLVSIVSEDVDLTVCLGDVVGYGPNPVECLELVEAHMDICILGNHDEALLDPTSAWDFNAQALASIEMTRRMVTPEAFELLRRYVRWTTIEDEVTFTHGSFGPAHYSYLRSAESAAASFEHLPTRIGVVGHTHLPSVFVCGDGEIGKRPEAHDVRLGVIHDDMRRRLPKHGRMILNPGSVGQPRDGNPEASWAVLDLDRQSFCVKRTPYDITEVEYKMQHLGMPMAHGQRLRVGA